jgi:hypothetical protein
MPTQHGRDCLRRVGENTWRATCGQSRWDAPVERRLIGHGVHSRPAITSFQEEYWRRPTTVINAACVGLTSPRRRGSG